MAEPHLWSTAVMQTLAPRMLGIGGRGSGLTHPGLAREKITAAKHGRSAAPATIHRSSP